MLASIVVMILITCTDNIWIGSILFFKNAVNFTNLGTNAQSGLV